MITRSISKEDAKKKYGNCGPGSKHVFINFEDLEKQRGIYEISISELIFDASTKEKIETDFTYLKTSKSYYPKPHVFKTIAELAGIRGVGSVRIEKEKDVIDINPLLAKPIEHPPTERKMHIATIAYSRAEIQCSDGTWRTSPECIGEHNFWQKAVKTWINAEKYNNNDYKKSIDRQVYLNMLMEHSTSIAQTKSFNACITYLIGITKGFSIEDLMASGGIFVFQKFIESPIYQQKIMNARIEGIRNGNTSTIKQISGEVFGDEKINTDIITGDESDNMDNVTPPPPPQTEKPKKENPFADYAKTVIPNNKEKLKPILQEYLKNETLKKTEGAIPSIVQALNNFNTQTEQEIQNIIDICQKIIDENGKELF